MSAILGAGLTSAVACQEATLLSDHFRIRTRQAEKEDKAFQAEAECCMQPHREYEFENSTQQHQLGLTLSRFHPGYLTRGLLEHVAVECRSSSVSVSESDPRNTIPQHTT